MQRPVMHPTFVREKTEPVKRRKKRLEWIGRILKMVGKLLFAHPFRQKPQFRNEEGSRLNRFFRAVTYRLAFVPVIGVAFLTALVFAATHPGRNDHGPDPSSYGIHYDPVNLVAEDGARLDAWLIPVLDAKRVLEQGDAVMGKRYPAVVLVHDFSASRQQVLPMINPLHNAGFVVLAINLRGAASLSGTAQTFGIREARDIKAAVEMLRRRSFVDPDRIAVVGVGTGANAALIAGRDDPGIAALVLAAPIDGFDNAFSERIGHHHRWLPPLKPLFRWTFQTMYGVDADELNLARFERTLASRPVLKTDGRYGLMEPESIRGVRTFLRQQVQDKPRSETAALPAN